MPVRYGIIGFGTIGYERIALEGFACDRTRFKPLEEVKLLGVCTNHTDRSDLARKLGLKWYSGADELLADPDIDAVYIGTNNLSHVPLALRALAAGKHVLSEKPLCSSLEQGRALEAALKQTQKSFAINHMMVYNQYNVKAKQLVAQRALGDVNDACFHMEFAYGFAPREAASWQCSDPLEMGGPIGDVGSHCFYMAEFILDSRIQALAAVYYPKTLDLGCEEGAYIKCRLENGITCSIKVAFNEPRGGENSTVSNLGFEIYGTEAVLRSYGTMFQLSGHSEEPIPLRLELDRFSRQETISVSENPIPNIYQEAILRHARSIAQGQPLDASEALANLKLCLAAHESARSGGKWIPIDPDPAP